MRQPSAACLQALIVDLVSGMRKHTSGAREKYDAVERCSLQEQLPEQGPDTHVSEPT